MDFYGITSFFMLPKHLASWHQNNEITEQGPVVQKPISTNPNIQPMVLFPILYGRIWAVVLRKSKQGS